MAGKPAEGSLPNPTRQELLAGPDGSQFDDVSWTRAGGTPAPSFILPWRVIRNSFTGSRHGGLPMTPGAPGHSLVNPDPADQTGRGPSPLLAIPAQEWVWRRSDAAYDGHGPARDPAGT